jgi:hypothetical protein
MKQLLLAKDKLNIRKRNVYLMTIGIKLPLMLWLDNQIIRVTVLELNIMQTTTIQ